ncbi:hypothetical protein GCM10027417_31760 [Glutamicibacter endophyticus]
MIDVQHLILPGTSVRVTSMYLTLGDHYNVSLRQPQSTLEGAAESGSARIYCSDR